MSAAVIHILFAKYIGAVPHLHLCAIVAVISWLPLQSHSHGIQVLSSQVSHCCRLPGAAGGLDRNHGTLYCWASATAIHCCHCHSASRSTQGHIVLCWGVAWGQVHFGLLRNTQAALLPLWRDPLLTNQRNQQQQLLCHLVHSQVFLAWPEPLDLHTGVLGL